MKYSNRNFEKLFGAHKRARHKSKGSSQSFRDPIIHQEIQGERIHVPLNLNKVWNKVY